MNAFRWRKAGQGEFSEKKAIGISILALVGLCFIAFFNQLGTLGFMDKTEGLFAEIPRQMLITGDWITPHWNTKTFFDYPVWGYWMVGLSYRVFGVTTWAARLPTALAASATVFAVFGTVLRLSTKTEGTHERVSRALLAATILALSPGWIGWGRTSVTDMFLSSSITLALLGFLLVLKSDESLSQRRIGHVCIALFSGIAVLAKGPVGVLLPGLTIILFLLLKRQLIQQIRSTPWLPMIALFCGVVLPWYAMASQTNGLEFLSKFIGFSNFERFTSVIYSHPGPPWFYLPWLFLLLLPWSIYLPVALLKLQFWKREAWESNIDSDDSSLFALVWLVVVIGFFSSAATKLAGYI
jgi:4-amino-4-deoxy-L-arabinose transferase-like glycosyltransferase